MLKRIEAALKTKGCATKYYKNRHKNVCVCVCAVLLILIFILSFTVPSLILAQANLHEDRTLN